MQSHFFNFSKPGYCICSVEIISIEKKKLKYHRLSMLIIDFQNYESKNPCFWRQVKETIGKIGENFDLKELSRNSQ